MKNTGQEGRDDDIVAFDSKELPNGASKYAAITPAAQLLLAVVGLYKLNSVYP
jgi:hypothetical protein